MKDAIIVGAMLFFGLCVGGACHAFGFSDDVAWCGVAAGCGLALAVGCFFHHLHVKAEEEQARIEAHNLNAEYLREREKRRSERKARQQEIELEKLRRRPLTQHNVEEQ